MTRINLVEPEELMDQHLLAEYREVRLLCRNLLRTLNSKHGFVPAKVPALFTLNTGHVYFFYNKGQYLHKRYDALRAEMRKRGMNPQFDFPRENWPDRLYNDWKANERDKDIVRERIAFRISQKPGWYKYYGKSVKPTSNVTIRDS